MKKYRLFFVFCAFLAANYVSARTSFGKPEKINDNWRFIRQDVKNAENMDFNDSRWQQIDLPHDWSVKGQLSPTLASCTGYLPGGIG